MPPRPKDAETLEKLKNDPRSKNYKEKCIIELDALVAYRPQEFKQLITESIDGLFDSKIYSELRKKSIELWKEINEVVDSKRVEAKKRLLEQLKTQLKV